STSRFPGSTPWRTTCPSCASRARSSRSWAASATRSPTSATSSTPRATARSSASGATRSTLPTRRTSVDEPLIQLQVKRPGGEGKPATDPAGAGKTVSLVSLGCPKNLVDSEVMLGHLRRSGYTVAAEAKDADVIVVNTCAFIDRAKQESVDAILE